MGKRNKKAKDDDWEADADALAEESAPAREPGALLDALFTDLVARGLATEAEADRATDELAGGTKSEEALVAEWQAKAEAAASFDNQWGHDEEGAGADEAVRTSEP